MSSVSAAGDSGYSQYMRSISELEDDLKKQADKRDAARNEEVADQDRKKTESVRKAEESFRRAAEAIRNNYSDFNTQEKANLRAEKERVKMETYDQNGKMRDEVRQEREKAELGVKSAQADYEHRLEKSNETSDDRFEKLRNAMRISAEEDEDHRRASHEGQIRELREALVRLNTEKSQTAKEKGEGTREAIQSFEKDIRMRERQMMERNEREIANQKHHMSETERLMAQKYNDSLWNQENKYKELVSQQNQANQAATSELRQEFNTAITEGDRRRSKEVGAYETYMAQIAERNSKEKDHALQAQAGAYQETIKLQREQDAERIKLLQNELHRTKVTDDTAEISPAAEARLRKAFLSHEKQVVDELVKREGESSRQLQEGNAKHLQQVLEEHQHQKGEMHKRYAQENDMQRSQLVQHIEELEHIRSTESSARDKDFVNRLDEMNHRHRLELENQKRRYDDAFDAARTETSARMKVQREEATHNQVMGQRESQMKFNDMIRENERRIQDIQNENEIVISELKANAESAARQAEQKSRIATEDLTRQFEQRIAQLESQYQERERVQTQNFQDELDRMKRTNALLVRKKS